ncbi:MAG: hypothetical protein H0U49_09985 [Parachlamydiaceae bacterium]|nr:hypothetical protein [Parachlamydiaceae bacterium]
MLGIGIFEPATFVAGTSLAGTAFLRLKEGAENEMKSNSWSYIFQVEMSIKS